MVRVPCSARVTPWKEKERWTWAEALYHNELPEMIRSASALQVLSNFCIQKLSWVQQELTNPLYYPNVSVSECFPFFDRECMIHCQNQPSPINRCNQKSPWPIKHHQRTITDQSSPISKRNSKILATSNKSRQRTKLRFAPANNLALCASERALAIADDQIPSTTWGLTWRDRSLISWCISCWLPLRIHDDKSFLATLGYTQPHLLL